MQLQGAAATVNLKIVIPLFILAVGSVVFHLQRTAQIDYASAVSPYSYAAQNQNQHQHTTTTHPTSSSASTHTPAPTLRSSHSSASSSSSSSSASSSHHSNDDESSASSSSSSSSHECPPPPKCPTQDATITTAATNCPTPAPKNNRKDILPAGVSAENKRYFESDIPDAELPKVKLHLYSDPWIPMETKNAHNDCSSYCQWVQREQIHEADGVVYSVPTHHGEFPSNLQPHALNIAICLEAINNWCQKMVDPGYLSKLHLISNYSIYSDIPALYTVPSDEEMYAAVPAKTADKLATFMSSRCVEPRTSFVAEVMNHLSVDSFGKCNHNANLPGNDVGTVRSTLGKYKFHIAVENANEDSYISEKFWKGFESGALPVYFGSDRVNTEHMAPGHHSFIYAPDFHNAKDLADYLNMLNNHPQLYERYFDWKKHPLQPGFKRAQMLDWNTLTCRTCRRVALMKKERLEGIRV